MGKNSLYEEILSCAKDGYDTNGIVEEWINDEAFDLFY